MDVDNGFESFKQLLSSTVLVVNPPNNTPFVELDRVRPLTPPSALDLVPEDIAGYRDSKQFYEAAHINNYHNGQFPEHKCEGCPNHNHNA
ncbi:unnamed protein product [Rhizophagus irregularis]|uniref:Uncharacterized protein n=1 Tax=Rhizophagus irregularis TaxID=588596 RepID=A0A916E562_9GLOM|nr:unnamed protein product [Rhizophagus irregularis]